MRTKQELYQAALRTVALRRQTARANAEDARLEAEAAIPALRHAEDEVRVRGIRCALAGAAGKDRTEAAAALSKARQELTTLLAASGRPADALEPKFTCKLCQDTGSVQGRTCTCVHKLMQGLRREEIEALSSLSISSFDTMELRYYPNTMDEKLGEQVGPAYAPITAEYLDYNEVMAKYDVMMDWLAGLYVNILNLIQYMHDKYYYEAAEMALIDTDVRRTFATGIAGFSHVVDSLSAIKYAKVKCIRNEQGLVTDYEIEGDFPKYGNDDDRADDIAVELLRSFLEKIKRRHTYRNSEATTSILTITSNVVYGKATGAMPDGRKAYTPFAPGGNPSYGAETHGLLASLNSVAKLPYHWALDGISNTQTINPDALGHSEGERINNLVQVMDGYFDQGAHHLNVNVFGTEKLIDAMEHPEKEEYANFTIRVSGYAVKFIDLTKEQQLDVIARTCHKVL